MFVRPQAFLRNNIPIFTKFSVRYLCLWLGPPLAALRYVMYFRFMDDVIFVHNGQYRAMEACRYRCSKVCHCVVVRLRRVLHDAGAETKRVHYASDAGRRRAYRTPFPCYVCQKDCV